jgi:mono/diheme cytochrome c family protein
LVFALQLSAPLFGQDVTFSFAGKKVASRSVSSLLESIEPTSVSVHEPHEDKHAKYSAMELAKLLVEVYNKDWRKAKQVSFVAVDGFRLGLSVDFIQKYGGFLAVSRLDRKEFKVDNPAQNEKNIPLEPLYLIWDNIRFKELLKYKDSLWIYQVARIELSDDDPINDAVIPPGNSSAIAKEGSKIFHTRCLVCHTINGVGGNKGPELNFPVNVTEYFENKWLKKMIIEPRAVRFNSTMPGFGGLSKNDIEGVLAYLRAMQFKKVKPIK